MSVFEKLAPFIQEYIYLRDWQDLREIQVAACDVIFNSDDNLLLSTPTASGKTEAAFLPVITEIYNKPPNSVGVLYIAPLKALINDQFVRIEELLQEADITVTKWHGDASQTQKNKLLCKPRGILQITPESLEAMLMNRKQQILTLFADLRFIIIDEVHNFLGTDRGVQLSAILQRIQTLTENTPRRIGLSATISNLSLAETWLNSGSGRQCSTPVVGQQRRKARIMLDHIYVLPPKQDAEGRSWVKYYEILYHQTQGKKCIIFANSRGEVERNIVNLKDLADKKREPDVFMVHHGSISASNREYAESQMKNSDLPLVTGATVTLELGIDLGDLDRIIQTGCPRSVSSLAQRLGRSGRRNGIAEMSFIFSEERHLDGIEWYKTINWQFIKCIALIELHREGWLEPTYLEKYPFSVLFHQTMSFLYSHGEASPSFLAQTILKLQAFSHITQEDFKELLMFMVETKNLEKTDNGTLLIGQGGEYLTNHYDFYTVFETQVEHSVRDKTSEIGTLTEAMPPKSTFVLAGKAWIVTELDTKKRVIYVEQKKGKPPTTWISHDDGFEYTKVLKKMKAVISENTTYPYLTANASLRLEEIRSIIHQSNCLQTDIFVLSPDSIGFFPWLGTQPQNTLEYALLYKLPKEAQLIKEWPLFIIKGVTKQQLKDILNIIKNDPLTIDDLALPDISPSIGKYADHVPNNLIRKQLVDKYTSIEQMQDGLHLF